MTKLFKFLPNIGVLLVCFALSMSAIGFSIGMTTLHSDSEVVYDGPCETNTYDSENRLYFKCGEYALSGSNTDNFVGKVFVEKKVPYCKITVTSLTGNWSESCEYK